MAKANKRVRDLSRQPRTNIRRFVESGVVMAAVTATRNPKDPSTRAIQTEERHPPKCTCHACRGRKGGRAKVPKGIARWSAAKRKAAQRRGGKARAAKAKRGSNGEFK